MGRTSESPAAPHGQGFEEKPLRGLVSTHPFGRPAENRQESDIPHFVDSSSDDC